VREEGKSSKDPAPIKVKQIDYGGHRYIVCLNDRQARKEARDREAIIASLEDQLKKGVKSIVMSEGVKSLLVI
jgi:hypothetical protein